MSPLIDLPAPTAVTSTERDAYALFASSYQRNWSTYMDPICLRVHLDPAGAGSLRFDLRVLPIVEASEYRQVQRSVGQARVEVPAGAAGAWVSLGVGERAELRHMVTQLSHELPSPLRAQLDWLGEVAFVGLEDRFSAKQAMVLAGRSPVGEADLARVLTEAPLHAGVAVKNRLTAGLTLAAIRKMIQDAAPGAVNWGERGKEKGVPYVAVSAARDGMAKGFAGELALYYAFCKDYLLLSLSESTLKSRIGDCVDGRLARAAAAGQAGQKQSPQLVFSLAAKKGGPSWQLLGTLVANALEESAPATWANVRLLREGAPGLDGAALRRLSMNYLGSSPMGWDGGAILGAPEAVAPAHFRHGHPVRTDFAVVKDDSLAGRVVAAFANARSEIAFDDEPTPAGSTGRIQSLHITLATAPAR